MVYTDITAEKKNESSHISFLHTQHEHKTCSIIFMSRQIKYMDTITCKNFKTGVSENY